MPHVLGLYFGILFLLVLCVLFFALLEGVLQLGNHPIPMLLWKAIVVDFAALHLSKDVLHLPCCELASYTLGGGACHVCQFLRLLSLYSRLDCSFQI